MDFLLAVVLFLAALIPSLLIGWPMFYSLTWGLICFSCVAMRRGFAFTSVLRMILDGMLSVKVVLRILFMLGFLTGIWRACGTVAFLVYYGVSAITPQFFILFSFSLTLLVSFLLGSSFGTTGTIGVVLMLLGRGGGADPAVTAGAILSGAYFGDRCAPVSSCASLVSALTETDLYANIRAMLRSSFIPLLLTVFCYAVISFLYPLSAIDVKSLSELPEMFSLGLPALLPAISILALAVLRVPVHISVMTSILIGCAVAVGAQGLTFHELYKTLLWGYEAHGTGTFGALLSGGGLMGMTGSFLVILLASGFAGIFEGAALLEDVRGLLARMAGRFSLYMTTLITSILSVAFSCNQTLAIVLTCQLVKPLYEGKKEALALDISDSVVLVSDVIPWSVAYIVPFSMLSVGYEALPWVLFPFILPIVRLAGECRKR